MKKWLWIGAGVVFGLALYLSGAVEGLFLALLSVGSAGALKITKTRKKTDETLAETRRTIEKYEQSKKEYGEEAERVEKNTAVSPIGDLLAAANERERKRKSDTTIR